MSLTTLMQVNQKVEHTRKNVWEMFDRIAHRYDLLNRLLSMRQDVAWRNKLTRYLPNRNNLVLLDVATGTADVLISLFKKSDKLSTAVGIDMAERMLDVGRAKLKEQDFNERISLQAGDATNLPFEEASFDVATIAFGIRNVDNLELGIKNLYRVLKEDGRVLILEFSLPQNYSLRGIYLFYFRHILPKIGSLLSGDAYAYNYLNQTVETFPYGEEFCNILKKNGFKNVTYHALTFGIASIYQGDK